MKDFKIGKIEGTDNNELKLLSLLNMVGENDYLICNGDGRERKQFSDLEIENAYPYLLKQLYSKDNFIEVTGNHDIKRLGMVTGIDKSYNYIRYVQSYAIIEGILFLHGHQYDWLNNRSYWMVNWVLDFLRWLEEKINPNIDIDLDRLLKFGRSADNTQKYINCAIEEAKRCSVKYVVLGHTHRKMIVKDNGIYYFNSGTWVNGKSDYLEFTLDDGRKIYCISDLHLGNKGKADDFWVT